MKKWENAEIENAIKFNEEGLSYLEIGELIDRTEKSVKLKLNKLGHFTNKKSLYEEVTCQFCGSKFKAFKHEERKFCSHSCSASANNPKKIKKTKAETHCLNCNKQLEDKQHKYCSNTCQHEYQTSDIYKKIENGDITLDYRHYKKYLIEKYGEKCMKCGWEERNPSTGNVPIELEHIDGNSENNNLSNLELLCPNCHSLTPTYKALNKGNGRHKRMQRYIEGKSY